STGSRLVSAAANGQVRRWSVNDAYSPHYINGRKGFVRATAFSPDGKKLATAVWLEAEGRGAWVALIKNIDPEGHYDPAILSLSGISALAFSRDSKQLFAGNMAGDVLVWREGQPEPTISGKRIQNHEINIVKQFGKEVLTVSNQQAFIYRPSDGRVRPCGESIKGLVEDVAIAPNAKAFAVLM